jgi:hypothetical protein
MIKTCHVHGETEFRNDSSVRLHYRCCKCQTEAVKRCRANLKERAVEYKGGCCERCGYNKCIQALEFHHIDPTQKDFAIGFKGHTRSFTKVKLEIDKCLLLCANCHREEHSSIRE